MLPQRRTRRKHGRPSFERSWSPPAPKRFGGTPEASRGAHAPRPRRQGSVGQRPPQPKPEADVPHAGRVPKAVGGPQAPRIAEPGAAAKDTALAVSHGPSRAVCRRALIIVVPAILHPFPDVAVDLVKPPLIGLEGVDLEGPLPVFALRSLVVGSGAVIVRLARGDGGAP